MDRYELLQFVHVAAAVVWVGGATILQFMALLTIASGDRLRLAAFARDVGTLGDRIFLPSALIVVVVGFILIWDGPWELSMTWVWLALVFFALSFVLGAFVLGPRSKAVAKLIEAEGPESQAVQDKIKELIRLGRIDIAILFAIVFLMVTKPS